MANVTVDVVSCQFKGCECDRWKERHYRFELISFMSIGLCGCGRFCCVDKTYHVCRWVAQNVPILCLSHYSILRTAPIWHCEWKAVLIVLEVITVNLSGDISRRHSHILLQVISV